MKQFLNEHKDEYNKIPINYCKDCLSPKIMFVEGLENSEYCDDCNSTNVATATIEEWDKLYLAKYKHHYLDKY